MTTIRFRYQLTDPATSVGSLTMNGQQAAYECYYAKDALAGFVRAVIALLRGASHAECVWSADPQAGVFRWEFTRQGDGVTISTATWRPAHGAAGLPSHARDVHPPATGQRRAARAAGLHGPVGSSGVPGPLEI